MIIGANKLKSQFTTSLSFLKRDKISTSVSTLSTCGNSTVQKTNKILHSTKLYFSSSNNTIFSGILQQRIELDKECMFQYTQLRKEVRMMDGQTSVAPVLMRFQRGCQQVRCWTIFIEIFLMRKCVLIVFCVSVDQIDCIFDKISPKKDVKNPSVPNFWYP